jgi:carboxymethylenebutenolidase
MRSSSRKPSRAPKLVRYLALLSFAGGLALPLHAQDWAKTRLEASPRHREYVAIQSNGRALQALVVYPEIKAKAPVVILIHEIFGLSDWAKEMADELAGAGYIVIAPDLVTGLGPNGGNSDSFPAQDATVKAVSGLNPEAVTADLDAVADYGKKLPAANGKLDVVGFCWGGGKSFAFATHRHDLSAAFVFYGPGPADVTPITAPVYGFYAGNDARIGATLPATTEAMKAAGKKYDPVTYEGAGHGFMRAGEDPAGTPENKRARDESFARLTKLLKQANTTAAISTPHPTSVSKATAQKPGAEVSCHDTTAMSME